MLALLLLLLLEKDVLRSMVTVESGWAVTGLGFVVVVVVAVVAVVVVVVVVVGIGG